jgi:hypothetical protein
MSKKVSISSKPASQKIADEWVTSRQVVEPAPEVTKRLTIDVPADLHSQIKVQCAREGVKMADAIREILRERFGGAA